eukprot:m.10673 g.10673  ORF g.10673 m.10673 type:complete len:242 (+) comp7120_c0_seq1:81-806(+)
MAIPMATHTPPSMMVSVKVVTLTGDRCQVRVRQHSSLCELHHVVCATLGIDVARVSLVVDSQQLRDETNSSHIWAALARGAIVSVVPCCQSGFRRPATRPPARKSITLHNGEDVNSFVQFVHGMSIADQQMEVNVIIGVSAAGVPIRQRLKIGALASALRVRVNACGAAEGASRPTQPITIPDTEVTPPQRQQLEALVIVSRQDRSRKLAEASTIHSKLDSLRARRAGKAAQRRHWGLCRQ